MRAFLKIVPLLFFLGITAVAQEVTYNYDRNANFSNYRTYKWVTIPGAAQPDQLTDQNIRQAISNQLAQKGLIESQQNPDLLVGYQLSLSQQQQIQTWGSPGWGYGWGGGMAQTTVTTEPVGTLVLDMYDPARKQLVWRGVATKTLDPNASPEKRQKNLDKGMSKLLKHYPPEEKK